MYFTSLRKNGECSSGSKGIHALLWAGHVFLRYVEWNEFYITKDKKRWIQPSFKKTIWGVRQNKKTRKSIMLCFNPTST